MIGLSHTRVTLATKGLYVGGLKVSLFLSNFAARRCFKALIKQLGLHAVYEHRCRQDEAVDDFRPR